MQNAATTLHADGHPNPWRGSPDVLLSRQRSREHKERCSQLPPIRASEADQLVAQFLAERGVTRCPAAFAAPVR